MKSREELSAGGVVYRRVNDTIEVLICKDAGYHRWVLPKGLVNKGEDVEQTAQREVEEEVGVRGRLVAPLGEEKYVYTSRGARVFKSVHYFLFEYVSGSEQDHDHEMEDVRWATIDEALAMLGYKGAREVLIRARDYLAQAANDGAEFLPPIT